jgi:hypothetical protein
MVCLLTNNTIILQIFSHSSHLHTIRVSEKSFTNTTLYYESPMLHVFTHGFDRKFFFCMKIHEFTCIGEWNQPIRSFVLPIHTNFFSSSFTHFRSLSYTKHFFRLFSIPFNNVLSHTSKIHATFVYSACGKCIMLSLSSAFMSVSSFSYTPYHFIQPLHTFVCCTLILCVTRRDFRVLWWIFKTVRSARLL